MSLLAILALVATTAASPPSPPKGSAEQRAQHERNQAHQTRFEQELFSAAGFIPLAEVAAEQRSVKRALFQNSYLILPVHGAEIEKLADGTVTLTVISRYESSTPVLLPASTWPELTRLHGTAFMPKPYVPWNPPATSARMTLPMPSCHGWIVRFGTADENGLGSGSWSQCGGANLPELAYAAEVARLAVSTRAECGFDKAQPFWSFQKCFSPPAP